MAISSQRRGSNPPRGNTHRGGKGSRGSGERQSRSRGRQGITQSNAGDQQHKEDYRRSQVRSLNSSGPRSRRSQGSHGSYGSQTRQNNSSSSAERRGRRSPARESHSSNVTERRPRSDHEGNITASTEKLQQDRLFQGPHSPATSSTSITTTDHTPTFFSIRESSKTFDTKADKNSSRLGNEAVTFKKGKKKVSPSKQNFEGIAVPLEYEKKSKQKPATRNTDEKLDNDSLTPKVKRIKLKDHSSQANESESIAALEALFEQRQDTPWPVVHGGRTEKETVKVKEVTAQPDTIQYSIELAVDRAKYDWWCYRTWKHGKVRQRNHVCTEYNVVAIITTPWTDRRDYSKIPSSPQLLYQELNDSTPCRCPYIFCSQMFGPQMFGPQRVSRFAGLFYDMARLSPISPPPNAGNANS